MKNKSSKTSLIHSFARLPVDKKRRLVVKSTVAVAVLGVAAGALSHYDQQSRELHDLTVIGQGQPVVVQIHDTGCPICRKLKSRTSRVLEDMDNIVYRIADIRSAKGREFQLSHQAEKTTLLLFDSEGTHIGTLAGLQTIEELRSVFQRSFPAPA